ncbi:hypothetical protein [Paenibacillus pabuli]|uniref:hypothetical protein n=1 Tax=Paenibacillus pabuli TaxID=1472 RepID=UPI001FFF2D5B|nr:hypothetical protein [Paenibacillus pabuli]UPK45951.1 hypothetical protein KET34_11080 [Paenibacillus pabuli]
MNNLQLSFSESTLNTVLKKGLSLVKQDEPISKPIVESNGVKITSNVQIKTIEVGNLVLVEPNKIKLNNVKLSFELLNIVVEVDIKRIHDKIKVVDLPGNKFDVNISWDFFGDEPDIRLTLGIEDYLSPEFNAEMSITIDGFDVIAELTNFQVQDLKIPSDLGEKIEQDVIDEVKRIISKKIGKWADKVLDFIGDLSKYLPVDGLSGWVVSKLTESEALKDLLGTAVKDNVEKQKLYTLPNQFELGKEQTRVTLSLDDQNPLSVFVKDSTLTGSVNFKDI